MNKKVLIFKEPSSNITVYPEYLMIKSIYHDRVISFKHIQIIYLSKTIDIDIATCYELSTKVPLFIIDHNGYILAEVKRLHRA
jgi:hypothetical protein